MRLASRLRRSRHGVYSFRLVFPASLRAVLRQNEIKRSLSTKSPAAARLLAYHLSAKMIPIIEEAKRLAAHFDPDRIDAQSIRKLIVESLRIGADGSVSADRLETTPGREAEDLREFSTMIDRARMRIGQRMAGEPTAAQLAERERAGRGHRTRAPLALAARRRPSAPRRSDCLMAVASRLSCGVYPQGLRNCSGRIRASC